MRDKEDFPITTFTMYRILLFLVTIITLSIILPSLVLADADPYGLNKTADAADIKTSDEVDILPAMIGNIINWFLGILGVVFFVFIIQGAFMWMMAGGNEEKVIKAKEKILNAIYGLIIIFISFALAWAVVDALSTATAT